MSLRNTQTVLVIDQEHKPESLGYAVMNFSSDHVVLVGLGDTIDHAWQVFVDMTPDKSRTQISFLISENYDYLIPSIPKDSTFSLYYSGQDLICEINYQHPVWAFLEGGITGRYPYKCFAMNTKLKSEKID